ncbi:MAG: YlmC/YmxH family sporulation protein [Bacilli bacterium]|nr:YlmC/YmxH family sporulation protein [Bacilli bacterium]MDD4733729.1 YlmC/YmxH family sporulation protein [Bacilli bacterium]
MKISDMQKKDVINLLDGKKIGNIIDIVLTDKGEIDLLIVEKKRFFLNFFSSNNEIEIKWSNIQKIGEDVILISTN